MVSFARPKDLKEGHMGERKALLVSDDPELCQRLTSSIKRAGLSIIAFRDMDRIAGPRVPSVDVILLDVSPSRPLNRSAPRRLRELLKTPWIILATPTDMQILMDAHVQADAYISKPIQEAELAKALNAVFEDRSLANQLSASHQQYEALFNAVPDAVLIYDRETHRFLDCNAAAIRLYGFTLDEFLQMTPFDLHPASERELVRERLQVSDPEVPKAYTHIRKDGRNIQVEVRTDEITYRGRPAWVTIVRDLTERAPRRGRMDEVALQQQRIESIGRLAGGIAHDFNNLLTTILGHAALALRKLPQDSPQRRNLETIVQSGERASAVVSQLLAFGGRQQGRPEILDLCDLISRTTNLLSKILGEGIELVFETQETTGLVEVDPLQLQQILVNLALNARDAMAGGGRLTFAVEPFDVTDEVLPSLPGLNPGTHVHLRVSDNGRGMDAETLAHAFEPFFTSKPNARDPVASGRGMGLAIVHGLVRQNRGAVTVNSRPGQGTSFDIYLPCTSAEAETRVMRAVQTGANKTVLVVEDEQDLCALVHAVLAEQGYEVLLARQTEEAWEIARRYPGPIHLLLTDAILPDGHGPDLAERLRQRRPGMGVICMSGHAPDHLAQQGIKLAGLTFLSKPFKIDELARLVKTALDDRSPSNRRLPSERLPSSIV